MDHLKNRMFLLGPPKCGTTSLHIYLDQHPEIYLSKIKETRFFDLNYEKGLDFYLSEYFENQSHKKIVGESTATYAFLPFVCEKIKEHFPNSKLIIMVRDPVQRAYSEWLMRKGKGDEPLSFLEALKENSDQKIKSIYDIDEISWKSRNENLKKHAFQPFRVYLQSSYYGDILELYLKYFSKDQIKIISFKQLKDNPNFVMESLFEFLNIDSTFKIGDQAIYNPYSLKKRLTSNLYKIFGKNIIQIFWKILPGKLRKRISTKLNNIKTDKPNLTKEMIEEAKCYFEKDREKFDEILFNTFQIRIADY